MAAAALGREAEDAPGLSPGVTGEAGAPEAPEAPEVGRSGKEPADREAEDPGDIEVEVDEDPGGAAEPVDERGAAVGLSSGTRRIWQIGQSPGRSEVRAGCIGQYQICDPSEEPAS